MKLKDLLNQLSESLKEDNPLINFGNKETTQLFYARYCDYSSWGSHFVEFDFISPKWSKSIMEPIDRIYTREIMFKRKSNAIRFIKFLNSQTNQINY